MFIIFNVDFFLFRNVIFEVLIPDTKLMLYHNKTTISVSIRVFLRENKYILRL